MFTEGETAHHYIGFTIFVNDCVLFVNRKYFSNEIYNFLFKHSFVTHGQDFMITTFSIKMQSSGYTRKSKICILQQDLVDMVFSSRLQLEMPWVNC